MQRRGDTLNRNKYEVFLKTVELRSLTKAGSMMGLTQSGVSHILNSLEEELGVKLLLRDRGGVYLNTTGRELLPYIQALCEASRNLEEKVSDLKGIGFGQVRIGTLDSISAHWLPKLIQDFKEKYTNVTFELQHGECCDIENWVQHGEVDIGFISEPSQLGLQTFPIKKDPVLMLLPAGHPLTAYSAVPQYEIKRHEHELMIDLVDCEIQDILKRDKVKTTSKFTDRDNYTIMALVEGGIGIGVMPELVIRRTPFLFETRELDPPVYRILSVAVRKDMELTPAASRFLSHMLACDFGVPPFC